MDRALHRAAGAALCVVAIAGSASFAQSNSGRSVTAVKPSPGPSMAARTATLGAPSPSGLASPIASPSGLSSPFPAGLPSNMPAPAGLTSGSTAITSPTSQVTTRVNADGTTTTTTTTPTDASGVPVPPLATAAARGVPAGRATAGSGGSPYTAQQIAQSFILADANRDGELTRGEAARLSILPYSFEEMDRNRDGILTRFEYEDGVR